MLLLSLNLFRLISSQHYSTPPYIVASEKAPTAYNATTTSYIIHTNMRSCQVENKFFMRFSNKNVFFYYFHEKLLSSLDNTAAAMYNCITETEQKEDNVMAWNFSAECRYIFR